MSVLRVAAVVLMIVVALRAPARADATEAELAAARRALITLRVLAYDKQLAKRAPGRVITVAVIATSSVASRTERAWWLAGFLQIPKVKVDGRMVRVVAIDYDTRTLAGELAKYAPAAVIVTGDLGTARAPILEATRARQTLSFSVREADVRSGIAVGLLATETRDQIVINLEASRAEGARFGAGLLQLARLVDEDAP